MSIKFASDSEAAISQIKQDIMLGALPPGIQLKMRELLPRYGIGASPMREALTRLTAEGFVEQAAQRGFRVPPTSSAELRDLTRSRQILEAEAIKLAIEHATPAWEDGIVASFHVLRREAERQSDAAKKFAPIETRHHRFHRALYAACPLGTLNEFCDSVYARMTRYRLSLDELGFTAQDIIAEHQLLMEAVLSRDTERAATAIRSHIAITADVIMKRLEAGEAAPEKKDSAHRSRRRVAQQE